MSTDGINIIVGIVLEVGISTFPLKSCCIDYSQTHGGYLRVIGGIEDGRDRKRLDEIEIYSKYVEEKKDWEFYLLGSGSREGDSNWMIEGHCSCYIR